MVVDADQAVIQDLTTIPTTIAGSFGPEDFCKKMFSDPKPLLLP